VVDSPDRGSNDGVGWLVSQPIPKAGSTAVLPNRLIAAVIVAAMLLALSGIVLSVIG
jgi:hypothetical protein